MPSGTQNTQIPGCGLHHISIQTRGLEESLRFYRDTLGMKVTVEFLVAGRPFIMLDMGDGCLMELQAPKEGVTAPAEGGPIAHFALDVLDVNSTVEKARLAGFPVTTEPKDVFLGTMPARVAFISGPNGESVELFQRKTVS